MFANCRSLLGCFDLLACTLLVLDLINLLVALCLLFGVDCWFAWVVGLVLVWFGLWVSVNLLLLVIC